MNGEIIEKEVEEITFYQDIKPLFTDDDRISMKKLFDLYKYNDVCDNAEKIYKVLKSGYMPPGRSWSTTNVEKFKRWIDGKKIEGIPPEREAFYRLLNIENFPEFLPIAKQMAHGYINEAKKIAEDPPPKFGKFGKFLKYFEFTQDAFDKRLEEMYTFIEEEGKKYVPANDHIYNSREDVIERIRQWAPFNQTDGAWLRNAVKTGPTDEITSLLSEIYQDELGNGKVELNHSTLYTTMLASCGIHLPKVFQKSYALDSKFLDSAFSAPTFALSISQFSDLFFPEILGITLLIEWTVLESVPIIKLFKYYGVDPHFYDMHVAIDNASTGHGAKAKRAIELYLDYVRQIGGEDEAQKDWKRIWTGFVAFWSVGTLASDFKRKIMLKRIGVPTLYDRMVEMIAFKAPYAGRNHNDRKFANKPINEWFYHPKKFLNALIESSYIVKGDPEKSPILTHITSWSGPMYKIFTEDELNLWHDWIRSLGHELSVSYFDIFTEMKRLIETLKNNQYDQPGHSHVLTGPDPNDDKKTITQDISWWLGQNDPTCIMKALYCEENAKPMVIKGKPADSPFITRLMSPANKMGSKFAEIAISRGPIKSPIEEDLIDDLIPYIVKSAEFVEFWIPSESWTWKDIAYKWIEDGCPLAEQPTIIPLIEKKHETLKNEIPSNVQLLYKHDSGKIEHHRHGPGCTH